MSSIRASRQAFRQRHLHATYFRHSLQKPIWMRNVGPIVRAGHLRLNSSSARVEPDSDAVIDNASGGVSKGWGKVHDEIRHLRAEVETLNQRFDNQIKGFQFAKNLHVQKKSHDSSLQNAAPVHVSKKGIKVGFDKVPNIWLRDNCQCGECVHETTRQRLLDTFSIPENILISSATKQENGTINIEWNDGHKSVIPESLIRSAGSTYEARSEIRQGRQQMKLWDHSISESPPSISVDLAENDNDVQTLVRKLREYGFCYINIPEELGRDPDLLLATTEKTLRRIAFIRETHYGGFYDFTADLASADTAYTNIALEAHTDNTYFSDPAGLQAFHLISHTEGEGGASLLVDGFKVAEELRKSDPKAYGILSNVNVYAHASGNDGISIQPYRGFPVLEHDSETGALLRVRWNSSDRAGIGLPIKDVTHWYRAARKFDQLLKQKENEYWEQLVPGRILVFDNWRVLHGRSSFTGKRRICGAYINRDDWVSKYKIMNFGQEAVLNQLGV